MIKKCKHKYCRRTAEAKRLECGTCHTQGVRRRHPVRYAYQALKDNAKRRGIAFSLTFAQFEKFAIKQKLIMGNRRHKDGYTIDRVNNDKGYTIDNIQVLTLQQNAIKGTRKLEYDWRTGYGRFPSIPEAVKIKTPF